MSLEEKIHPVTITERAAQVALDTMEEHDGPLRIAIRGGGCSGFEYALDFDSADAERNTDDLEYEMHGLTVRVDPISARYLKGTVIDYVTGINATGFKFTNPNAKGSCGCGSSFSV